jgi:glycosyltransferase involved in cell wall biosynthesis
MLRSYRERARLLRDVSRFDAAYVFREITPLGPAAMERVLAKRGLPYIYDFDDAVFVPYRSPSNGYLSLLKYPPKTKTACRLAAHVMAGNSYLAAYASKVNDRVSVVPSTIDLHQYQRRSTGSGSGPPVIGWTGSHSTVQHLETVGPALQRLAASHEFVLRVIGVADFRLPGVDVHPVRWRSETEVDDLAPIDIGIMPLPDTAWTRGKCGMKALQYMALGIATVCSPVGVNTDIIDDGSNGLLASTTDEWVVRLAELLGSPDRRAQLGAAGRQTVEQRFDGAQVAGQVASIFRAVAAARARA